MASEKDNDHAGERARMKPRNYKAPGQVFPRASGAVFVIDTHTLVRSRVIRPTSRA